MNYLGLVARGFHQKEFQTSLYSYRDFQKIEISPVASLHMILAKIRITKALIRLRGCAGWSAPVLFANPRRQVFLRRGPFTTKMILNVLQCELFAFHRTEVCKQIIPNVLEALSTNSVNQDQTPTVVIRSIIHVTNHYVDIYILVCSHTNDYVANYMLVS